MPLQTYRNASGERRIWPYLPQHEGGHSYDLGPDETVELEVETDADGNLPRFSGLEPVTAAPSRKSAPPTPASAPAASTPAADGEE